MSDPGTAERAQAISNLAGETWQHLQSAALALEDAVRLVDGTGVERLRDCLGGIRLAKSVVSGAQLDWAEYAQVRRGKK